MKEWNFFDERGILGESDTILLRKIKPEELQAFGEILSEGKRDKASYQTEESLEFLREELEREDALYCGIIRKTDDTFCGYVGISELTEEPWEFAIELYKRYHRQGIGFCALHLFLTSIKERTGVKEFKSLVDGLNLASQKLMEKVSGSLINITIEDGKPVMEYRHIL